MKSKRVAFLFFFILIFSFVEAQQDFGLKSEAYYKVFEKEYQQWLIDKKLDKYLKVTGSDTKDSLLTFYLGFTKTSDDSALFIWKMLKQDFAVTHDYSLEEWLYKSMISLVRINPNYANLQLYSTLSNGERGTFYRAIYYTDKKINIVERDGGAENFNAVDLSSSVSKLRSLHPTKLSFQRTKYRLNLKNTSRSKRKVFAKIIEYSKQKYKNKVSDFSRDFYVDYSRQDMLYFEVRNLKGEVFSDEDNNFVAEFVSWFLDEDIDWRTIEELHFNIKYIPDRSAQRFTLEFDIKGKYGSGFHNNHEWEKMFDMEKDFDPKLERYQKQFANEIFDYLSK